MKKILIVALCCLFLCGCDNKTSDQNNNSNQNNNNNNSQENNNQNNNNNQENNNSKQPEYKLDTPFTFDDLEITIGSEYSFDTIANQFSDYNGQSVVKVPITVKNLKDETHSLNMFYYSLFGSQGTELDEVSAYFDDTVDYAGDLRSGASYTKYLYFLYDGNGTYAIEFNNWSDKVELEFEITK